MTYWDDCVCMCRCIGYYISPHLVDTVNLKIYAFMTIIFNRARIQSSITLHPKNKVASIV